MQVNPQLKKAILEALGETDFEDRAHGRCLRSLYRYLADRYPRAPWLPNEGNINVITQALQLLEDSGAVELDRRQRKLYMVRAKPRTGETVVLEEEVTEMGMEPEKEEELTVIKLPEPEPVADVLALLRTAPPDQVARELLKLVIQISRTPRPDPAEQKKMVKKTQDLAAEVSRLQTKLNEATRISQAQATNIKRLDQDVKDLREGNQELGELLRLAEEERDEWKRKFGQAAAVAQQYQDTWVTGLLDASEKLPLTTLDEILSQASPIERA